MRRSALVTGASRGIGRGIARALAEKGWPVCVNYLEHRDAAESLAEELRKAGRNAIIYQADVSDRKAVEAMVRAASEALGPVELLVNNAGIAQQTLFQDTDDAAWSRMLAVNLTGPRNTVMAALPHMLNGKTGLYRECVVHLGPAWFQLRDGLRGFQGGIDRPDPVDWPWNSRRRASG